MQLFIVSNHTKTWYFANNNIQHFDFDADEKFLPIICKDLSSICTKGKPFNSKVTS
jgi:hypothetical protein